jgi:ubiquitin-like 1-activating enzyme E1 A
MDGGSRAEGELTTQETALYDRQIRLWGVDAQKRCAAAQELIPFTCIYYLCFRSL